MRKTTKGRSGSLRTQFNYYKRQYLNRLIKEIAYKEARGVGGDDIIPVEMFKNIDYDIIMKKGITRKIGNKTVRITGVEAIVTQINSLRLRASKTAQNRLFINNYVQSMYAIGVDINIIKEVYSKLNATSVDKLTYLINEGILPQIAFIYATEGETDIELYENILNALSKGITQSELKEYRTRAKLYEENIRNRPHIQQFLKRAQGKRGRRKKV